MPTRPSTSEFDAQRLRRVYRFMFSASVCLAAIGAPLLMQGTVALVGGLTAAGRATLSSAARGIGTFVLSGVPMALAWLAWRKTQDYNDLVDRRL